ncbi:hypothetical protein [Bradyrhizobium jicamae]|uniref:hypothetical protein n=1 Tax=Bradyrhizobium jicamae TaxID=280332 RepID=UPI001BA86E88|nr:hypothetical protein [Bradyrhizobium jicamae]MBR0934849.1 hypothetical protein [Bradyrhizobium jicamae]
MTKAAVRSSTTITDITNPDAALLGLIAQHDAMFDRLNDMCIAEDEGRADWDRAEHDALSNEAERLAALIISVPASTQLAIDGKMRVAQDEDFLGDNLTRSMLILDRKRINAARIARRIKAARRSVERAAAA